MNQIFHTKKTVTFREADPAKIMFFGNIFAFAHDAFEQFLPAAGYTWKEWFHNTNYLIPIRHTEGDFNAPFLPGETYDIAVTVASFGTTSFKMRYIFSKDKKTHAEVTMVHSLLDGKTHQKTPLPETFKTRFGPFLESGESHGRV